MDCSASPVEQLKTTLSTTITVNLDDPAFKGLERVRVDEIQVRLVGAKPLERFVTLRVSNDGVLYDRLNNVTSAFMGDEWSRIVKYKLSSVRRRSDKQIIGDVYEEFSKVRSHYCY